MEQKFYDWMPFLLSMPPFISLLIECSIFKSLTGKRKCSCRSLSTKKTQFTVTKVSCHKYNMVQLITSVSLHEMPVNTLAVLYFVGMC